LKIVGAFLIFLALYGFQEGVTFVNVLWLVLGVFLVAVEEWVTLFSHTVRYVYKGKQ
jgi:membrane-bound ClpP family serine protease